MPSLSPAALARLQITLTTIVGAFALGAESYLEAYFTSAHPVLSWKAAAIGALLAGAAAVRHHYMDPPKDVPTPPSMLRKTGALLVLLVPGCHLPQPETPHEVECKRRYDECDITTPRGSANRAAFEQCMAQVDADCLQPAVTR